jgi:3-oxoacyl-[acyl-carrier-protein] synthase-3
MNYFKSLGHVLGTHEIQVTDLLKSTSSIRSDLIERTGFKKVYISGDETLLEMCFRLLDPYRNDIQDIDLLISVSSIQKQNPGLGSQIHQLLKLSVLCDVLEIQDACTGFVRALDLASSLLDGNRYKKILIVMSDQYSKLYSSEQVNISSLFSDGTSAQILTSLDKQVAGDPSFIELKNLSQFYEFESDGARHLNIDIERNQQLFMKGGGVFQFVLSRLPKVMSRFEALSYPKDEINWYVHQGSYAVVEAVEKVLNSNQNSLFRAESYGNLVGSSIPAQFLDFPLEKGRLYGFLGFGMGLRMHLGLYRTGDKT